jgi:hypothetical protein
MKYLLNFLILFALMAILTTFSSCKSCKTDSAQTESKETSFTVKNGIIIKQYFQDKGGNMHYDIFDYYFLCADGEDFIKLSECENMDGEISDYTNFYVKANVKTNDGLWDTNDPNVQSRVGQYVVFKSIEKIGYPIEISYSDGNSNEYLIKPEVINYIPVSPENSSSGIYSGGSAVVMDINPDNQQFNMAFIKAIKLKENKDIVLESRPMGSGLIKLKFKNSEMSVIIKDCSELSEFEDYLKQLLNK